MRLLIILGFLVGAVVLGVKLMSGVQVFGAMKSAVIPSPPASTQGKNESRPPAPSPEVVASATALLPHGATPPLVTPAETSAPVPDEPPVGFSYRFLHRETPGPDFLADLAKFGVQAIADKATGQIAIRGKASDVDLVVRYLQGVDSAAGTCAVQSWAVFVDRSAQKGFDLVAAVSAVAGAVPDSATIGGGSITLNLTPGDVAAALSVIADGSAVEVVQRPYVRLTQGITAKIESTEEVPIPTATLSNGISQSSVTYRKVGLQLEVTPTFLDSDAVRLAVSQSNGIVGDSVDIGGSDVPVIQSQTVQTTAEMKIGQTIVLGGVATQRKRTVRGILRNTTETTDGALYVILSTYRDTAAGPAPAPDLAAPVAAQVPLASPMESPADWVDSQLLPSKGWQAQEAEFVASKSAIPSRAKTKETTPGPSSAPVSRKPRMGRPGR